MWAAKDSNLPSPVDDVSRNSYPKRTPAYRGSKPSRRGIGGPQGERTVRVANKSRLTASGPACQALSEGGSVSARGEAEGETRRESAAL